MTTEELIAILEQHPGKRVVVDGYESGMHDVFLPQVKVVKIKLDLQPCSSIDGPHGFATDWTTGEAVFDEEALLISRPEG